MPRNGDVVNWWLRRRPTFGGFGRLVIGGVANVSRSCGGFAPSRLEYATGSDVLLVSANPYAPAVVTTELTSSSTHEPAVGTAAVPIAGPEVDGLLFHVRAVSLQVAVVWCRTPVVALESVTNRRSLALVGCCGSAGTLNRTNGWYEVVVSRPWSVVWVPKFAFAWSDRTYESATGVSVVVPATTWMKSDRTRVLVPVPFVTVSDTA